MGTYTIGGKVIKVTPRERDFRINTKNKKAYTLDLDIFRIVKGRQITHAYYWFFVGGPLSCCTTSTEGYGLSRNPEVNTPWFKTKREALETLAENL